MQQRQKRLVCLRAASIQLRFHDILVVPASLCCSVQVAGSSLDACQAYWRPRKLCFNSVKQTQAGFGRIIFPLALFSLSATEDHYLKHCAYCAVAFFLQQRSKQYYLAIKVNLTNRGKCLDEDTF